jgi:hypothetical protein
LRMYSAQAQRALVARTSALPFRPRRRRSSLSRTTSIPAKPLPSRGVLRLAQKGAIPGANHPRQGRPRWHHAKARVLGLHRCGRPTPLSLLCRLAAAVPYRAFIPSATACSHPRVNCVRRSHRSSRRVLLKMQTDACSTHWNSSHRLAWECTRALRFATAPALWTFSVLLFVSRKVARRPRRRSRLFYVCS